jgi:hypothetical protein
VSRGSVSRRAALSILPLVALLLMFAALAEYRSGEAERQREADRIGGLYASEVATFRVHTLNLLAEHRGEHAEALRDLLDRELAAKPVLAPAPGADKSRTYQAAQRTAATAFKPFEDLRTQLDTVAKAEVFVKGADAELQKATVTLLGSSLVWDTKPLYERTLPELRQELSRFRQLEVPPGGETAARTVDGTLSAAVHEVETMAKKLDDGDAYQFDLTGRFDDARARLRDYAVVTDGDLAEAMGRVRDAG